MTVALVILACLAVAALVSIAGTLNELARRFDERTKIERARYSRESTMLDGTEVER